MSNLAYQGKRFKELLAAKIEGLTDKFNKLLSALQYNVKNASLILMVIGLISNLCTDTKIREYMAGNPYGLLGSLIAKIKEMIKEKPVAYFFLYCRWDDYVDQIMSLMVNVSLNDNSHSVIISAEFPSTFDKDIKLIIKKHHKVANKFFNLTSKMSKEPKYILQLLQTNNVFSCFFESIEPTNDLADDSIRLLARFLDLDYTCAKIEECKIDTDKFSVNIRATLKDACETQKKERYANGCTLANRFLKR